MHRNDNLKDEIIVGSIPAGTGNGLSKTLSELHQENYDSISFAYMICKGQSIKLDLFELETPSQSYPIYAFHSVSSGLIAEVGILSEFMKFIGDIRFKIYGLWRLLTLNSKHFYTSMFYPEKEEEDERSIDDFPELSKELPENMRNLKDEIRFMYIMNLKWTTEVVNAPDPTKYDDGLMDIVVKNLFIYSSVEETGNKCGNVSKNLNSKIY
jgi:sphingosine kinase